MRDGRGHAFSLEVAGHYGEEDRSDDRDQQRADKVRKHPDACEKNKGSGTKDNNAVHAAMPG